MKKRVNDLLNGTFEYRRESFAVSEEYIEERVACGGIFKGKFSIRAQEGKSVQGFVYSTNLRVAFSPAVFFSSRETITYEVDTKGMKPGSTVEGAFILCTEMGERTIPYKILAESEKKEVQTALGVTPEAFASLAKRDYGQAYVLFVSREFPGILESWGGTCRALYEGLKRRPVSYQSMEQFLVGSGLKEPVRFRTETDHIYLHDLQESTREDINLVKSTWGFARLSIQSDADFLTIERPQVTTEEFVGSTHTINYMVDREKLHAGRNFARIRITDGCRELCVDVEVRQREALLAPGPGRRQKQEITGMMSAYIDYRAGRTGREEWLGLSLSYLENYRRAEGSHIFFALYEIFLRDRKEETLEAELLLQQVTERKAELAVPQWKGCYLYLTTLRNREKDYLAYVQSEVERLFLENQENWILQWLMFRVNAHLIKNDTEKLDSIRRQYVCGCHSPVMYLEAADILKREPLMLRSLGEFEIHLLRFLCREHLLDREICGQTAQLAARRQDFHRILFGVLCRCYEVYPTKNMLHAICTMLIKGHKNNREYAKWYALGVMQDLRITGLYEYYVETMEQLNDKLLPQAVRMYFRYHNTLDYVRKAAIYANIIRNRAKDARTYENYRQAIELFMEEQLLAGRINRDLALLYETMVTKLVLDKPLAQGLANVLFTCEVYCSEPKMKHVAVLHEQLKGEQRAMLSDGVAYVRIYSPECSILLEDGDGNRYAAEGLCRIERLLTRPDLEAYCRELAGDCAGLLIHDCCQTDTVGITEENAADFVRILGLDEIRDAYKRRLQEALAVFYVAHPLADGVREFLLLAQDEVLAPEHKEELAKLLVGEGMEERAYGIVCRYGTDGLPPQTLVRICSFRVRETEEEDPFLTALCAQCFLEGVYEEAVLKYLLRYYEGPIGYMKALWRAGKGFELEAYVLSERILTMLLFEREGMEDTEEIFREYWEKQGKAKICRAYVTLMSYRYFVQELAVGDAVFQYLEQEMLGSVGVADVCRLALLRFYALQKKLTQGQQKWLHYLLRKYYAAGMRFRIYKRLPQRLQKEFHLEDKYIVEYRTDPANTVALHYQLNGGKEQSILLPNVFEGIFTKEFTLFYLDELTWYFTVEENGKKTDTPKQTFTHTRRSSRGSTARYDLINRLIEAEKKQDEALFREIMEQYIGQQYLVDELFG